MPARALPSATGAYESEGGAFEIVRDRGSAWGLFGGSGFMDDACGGGHGVSRRGSFGCSRRGCDGGAEGRSEQGGPRNDAESESGSHGDGGDADGDGLRVEEEELKERGEDEDEEVTMERRRSEQILMMVRAQTHDPFLVPRSSRDGDQTNVQRLQSRHSSTCSTRAGP